MIVGVKTENGSCDADDTPFLGRFVTRQLGRELYSLPVYEI